MKKRIMRYILEALSGFVPFAGGLLSATASMWSDREADKTTRMLLNQLQTRQTRDTPISLVVTEQAYRAEITRLQNNLHTQALYINRPRLFRSRRQTDEKLVTTMIYSHVYKRKIQELIRRKKISDQLYKLEVAECKLTYNDKERRAIALQRIAIAYGKTDGLEPIKSLLMSIVPR